MYTDLINIALAFIEGFALIISPCILPILPIILSSSLTGSKARPLGIVIGFILSFTIVTLFSRFIIQSLHIDPNILRNISLLLLFLLGLFMLSSRAADIFSRFTQRLTRVGSSVQTINNPEGGLWSGLLFGTLIGIIWTPCAGPILAAVIVQIVTQETTLDSSLTVIAFAIGAGLPMLLIALLGRKFVDKFSLFRQHANLFRKLLGLIIIFTVIFLYYYGPAAFTFTSDAEIPTNTNLTATELINGLEQPIPAPEIAGIEAWLNSPPLQINSLKGKVILIDFWTYSCINCLRTLPYLKNWYNKYKDKGFIIIGIHSPEFQFEHDLNNVKEAVNKLEITYPVALDNRFATWKNYNNEFWPAHYLIDKNGTIVYEHFGEGKYDVTENNIRFLLGLTGKAEAIQSKDNYSSTQSPETYLGYGRVANFSSPETIKRDEGGDYTFPASFALHDWALNGKWKVMKDKIVSLSNQASIRMHFKAGKVYAVMGVTQKPVKIQVLYNDKPIKTAMEVNSHQLYTVFESPQEIEGSLTIIASSPGLEIYTFTFGS